MRLGPGPRGSSGAGRSGSVARRDYVRVFLPFLGAKLYLMKVTNVGRVKCTQQYLVKRGNVHAFTHPIEAQFNPVEDTHELQRPVSPYGERRMRGHDWLVLLLVVAAGAAGVVQTAMRASAPALGDLSACTAPLQAAQHVTMYSTGQTVFFDLQQTVTFKETSPIAADLAQEASANSTPFYGLCYFPGFNKVAAFHSSGRGLVTFSNDFSTRNHIPSLLSISGWTTTLHAGAVGLAFQSSGFCHSSPGSLPVGWDGTQLTATLTTTSSVSNLSALPTSHSGDNYVWSFAKLDCKKPPTITLSAHVPLVTYADTRIVDAPSVGPTWINLLSSLFDVLVLLTGFVVWLRNRRLLRSATRMLVLLAISSLGLAATFFYGGSDALTPVAALFAIYGIILALMLRGRLWLRVGVGVIITALAIAAVPLHVHYRLSANTQHAAPYILGAEVLVALCMAISGVLAYRRLHARLHRVYIDRLGPGRTSLRLDLALLYGWALVAAAFVYSLCNVQAPRDVLSIALAEIGVPAYALYPFILTFLVIALVLPLVERGTAAARRQLCAGIIGFAFAVQLPDPSFALSSLPLAEVIFAGVLLRLASKEQPLPDLTSAQSCLRTATPAGDPFANLLLAVKIAAVVAIIPVVYFTYTALTSLPGNLQFIDGAIFAVAGVVSQAAGWIVIGVVFSLINNRLPGGSGPLRAVAVSALWFGVGIISFVVSALLHGSLNRSWTFFGLQLFLFLLAFSAVWDACILGKLRWASLDQLRDAYNLNRVRTIALYAAPLLLALIALGQQVVSGSGVQFVQSALTAVPSIFGK